MPAARSDEEFGAKVRAGLVSSYRTYGARRVWHDLLAEGLPCRLHRIERLMRVHGLKARPRRRGLPKDDGLPSSSMALHQQPGQIAAIDLLPAYLCRLRSSRRYGASPLVSL
jgi:transposase InsO family protein